jgi:hypothetical protein
MIVKKSAICYFLNNNIDKVSVDRLRRFYTIKSTQKYTNHVVKDKIFIGDFAFFKYKTISVVCHILGFTYKSKAKKCQKYSKQFCEIPGSNNVQSSDPVNIIRNFYEFYENGKLPLTILHLPKTSV